jgi:hypothetical protein
LREEAPLLDFFSRNARAYNLDESSAAAAYRDSHQNYAAKDML